MEPNRRDLDHPLRDLLVVRSGAETQLRTTTSTNVTMPAAKPGGDFLEVTAENADGSGELS